VLTDVLTSPSTGAAQYALSDTGRLVYAPGTVFGKSRRLVMIDAEGNESDTGLPPDRYSYVKFAPDGQQLAIEIEGDTPSIWIFGIDNGRLEKIVSNATYPVWSPDSDKIAYSDISSGGTAIYQVDVRQAQDIQKIIEADLPLDHSYAWSPDGGHFAYTLLNRDSGMDIMIIQLSETATPRPLIVSFFNECCPAFSSDGRWLAYVSDMTGRPEVHIVSFPGLEETHQISKGGAREPV
ncbi:MAG: hypothetical protein GTO60_03285, partial [Gammaproteobacteria bacterium]|nr:hypothetical protein [Gammaproteobacteria bacterium]NIO62440.1 hypothetical protein [Gammaproteobacteria bacterium]